MIIETRPKPIPPNPFRPFFNTVDTQKRHLNFVNFLSSLPNEHENKLFRTVVKWNKTIFQDSRIEMGSFLSYILSGHIVTHTLGTYIISRRFQHRQFPTFAAWILQLGPLPALWRHNFLCTRYSWSRSTHCKRLCKLKRQDLTGFLSFRPPYFQAWLRHSNQIQKETQQDNIPTHWGHRCFRQCS